MKLSHTIKKVLEKINNYLARESKQKLAQLDRHVAKDNFLNESFEDEIEENLANELVEEARLAFLLASSPSCCQGRLHLQLASGASLTVISGCQQAGPQHR